MINSRFEIKKKISNCTVETVCCFLPQCGQLKKHGKNQIKSKKTCFFLFLFCFLTVFLICTFVQNYNHTVRYILSKTFKERLSKRQMIFHGRITNGSRKVSEGLTKGDKVSKSKENHNS